MKKLVISLKIVLPAVALIFLVSACNKSSSTPPARVKSATVTFKATAKKTAYKSTSAMKGISIPVKGGALGLKEAWINFGHVDIQENTGNDGQYTGNTGGVDTPSSTTETKDSADIYLPGPYAFNVLSDTITLSNVKVFPGTFKKVNLTFMVKNGSVFNGHSIVIKGSFTPTGGTVVQVELQSKFAQQVELKLAKGITVTANSKVSLSIVFNLNKWLNAIDLTKATKTSGKILIDATHNQGMLKNFEAALSNQGMEINEDHGDTSPGSDNGTETGGDSSD